MFIGCSTGHGDNSLVDVVVAQGATVAVGFNDSVAIEAAQHWLTAFFEAMSRGNTVEDSIQSACIESEKEYGNEQYYVAQYGQKYKKIVRDVVELAGDGDYVL